MRKELAKIIKEADEEMINIISRYLNCMLNKAKSETGKKICSVYGDDLLSAVERLEEVLKSDWL